MTYSQMGSDHALAQRRSMFGVAVKAAARHKFGLAFHVSHMDPITKEPQGWLREQVDEIRMTWTTDSDTFPDLYFNEGIAPNECWPVLDNQPVQWFQAVQSRKGLGRLKKLYVGGE